LTLLISGSLTISQFLNKSYKDIDKAICWESGETAPLCSKNIREFRLISLTNAFYLELCHGSFAMAVRGLTYKMNEEPFM